MPSKISNSQLANPRYQQQNKEKEEVAISWQTERGRQEEIERIRCEIMGKMLTRTRGEDSQKRRSTAPRSGEVGGSSAWPPIVATSASDGGERRRGGEIYDFYRYRGHHATVRAVGLGESESAFIAAY